jgi:hypothetical protein
VIKNQSKNRVGLQNYCDDDDDDDELNKNGSVWWSLSSRTKFSFFLNHVFFYLTRLCISSYKGKNMQNENAKSVCLCFLIYH